MKSILDLTVEEVIEKYDPHTIILYGSRARGDFTDASDIDIACFCENGPEIKIAKLFHGTYLDLWVYPTISMNDITKEALRFSCGVLKLDRCGYGDAYLQRVNDLELQGPGKLAPADREHANEWLSKMLSRVQSEGIESNYRRVWLQFELLEMYFNFRGLWFSGSKVSFQYLKENDPLGYELFERVYAQPENVECLFELVCHVKG
jgi:predicted nucleotidyltransferase